MPAAIPSTIAFRVDLETAAALVEHAARLGVSPHDMARELVRLGLQQVAGFAELGGALDEIRDTLRQLRGDVATTAEALLVTAGGQTREAAYEWVEKNILKACSPSQNR
ncbi:MAG: ribbon-helix-helix protein, CopG family [Verrucomicrobiales bacterium]|nr:ribbon-helix-helix protein, CopG family [Verrucomicrobiales bacterium]